MAKNGWKQVQTFLGENKEITVEADSKHWKCFAEMDSLYGEKREREWDRSCSFRICNVGKL